MIEIEFDLNVSPQPQPNFLSNLSGRLANVLVDKAADLRWSNVQVNGQDLLAARAL